VTNTYLNTDLRIQSEDGLEFLVRALELGGLVVLHEGHEGAISSVTFETAQDLRTPERTMEQLLSAIEALVGAPKAQWQACCVRELDLGFASPAGRFSEEFSLSASLLTRITRVGASLRITIYQPQ
jgi:hypothetical protein